MDRLKQLFLAALLALLAPLAASPAFAQGLSGPGCGNGVTCSALAVAPQSTTITIGSGGQYPTVTAALAAINNQVLVNGSNILFSLQDGVISEPGVLNWFSLANRQINIQGQHSYSFTLSSVQSSSGSAGAWTYVLNLNTVTNIAVGDYLTVIATTGGTNPTYVSGVWPVTNVDAVNNRVTVTTTGNQAAAASGAVAGSVVDMKSTLKFTNSDGFDVWDGASVLNPLNFNIVGDGSSGHVGINLQDVGRVNAGSMSISGFGAANIFALYNSEFNASGNIVSSGSGQAGILFESGAVMDINGNVVTSGNTGYGVQTFNGAVNAHSFISSGNTADGLFTSLGGSITDTTSTFVTGNGGMGLNSGTAATLSLDSVTSANNGTADQTAFSVQGLISGQTVINGNLNLLGSQSFTWTARSFMSSPADSQFLFSNNSGSQQFTMNTSSSGQVVFGGSVQANGDLKGNNVVASNGGSTSNVLGWLSHSIMQSATDGNIELSANSGSGFTCLQYGGTSTSSPAMCASGTTLKARLADNSADAGLTAATPAANDNSTSVVTTAFVQSEVGEGGSVPTLSGTCTTASQVGGNTVGQFAATCTAQTVIITFAVTAPHGWVCVANDITTSADTLKQTATGTGSCTLTGTTVASDTVLFSARKF